MSVNVIRDSELIDKLEYLSDNYLIDKLKYFIGYYATTFFCIEHIH